MSSTVTPRHLPPIFNYKQSNCKDLNGHLNYCIKVWNGKFLRTCRAVGHGCNKGWYFACEGAGCNVPFAGRLWGTSRPRGAGRWMLDRGSAVRASAWVFSAKVPARSALCSFFSSPNSAVLSLCFAFHLLKSVYWFSVTQTAIEQRTFSARASYWACPQQFKHKLTHHFYPSAAIQWTCN